MESTPSKRLALALMQTRTKIIPYWILRETEESKHHQKLYNISLRRKARETNAELDDAASRAAARFAIGPRGKSGRRAFTSNEHRTQMSQWSGLYSQSNVDWLGQHSGICKLLCQDWRTMDEYKPKHFDRLHLVPGCHLFAMSHYRPLMGNCFLVAQSFYFRRLC